MKRIYSVFSFLMIVLFLHGQYDPKENFYDAEFFFAEEDYAEALYAFNQVYKEGYQDNSNINYRIGICLLKLEDRKVEAIPYLEKAVANITEKYKEGSFKEVNAPPDAFLYLANAYRIDEKFDKAITNYNTFLEYEGVDAVQQLYANLQIDACKLAKQFVGTKGDYTVGTLGQINMIRAPVYNPAVSGDLNTFAFMGRQKFYNGVYISRKKEGKWLKPYNITPSIQSDGNQTVLSLSYDGNKLLVSWADRFTSDIWITEYKNDRWYKSEPLGRPINSKYYESHACFTPDGKTIYFTSNRKESLGGMDIFRSTMNNEGIWGELELLGENVNTPLNEEHPFVSPDGKRLYFNSQGHKGIGGFDIYYCEINADNSLGPPIALDYPLNTPDDDFTFMPRDIGFENYLTVYAKGENDQVDLFRFEWIPESAQSIVVAFDMPLETEEVVEVVEEEVVEEEVVEEEVVEEEVVEEEEVEEEEVEKYILQPIFFDFDSYQLTDNGVVKLNGLASIMSRFPNISIEIIGHTDNVGKRDYNKILAESRAKSVAKYLVSNGIDESRLTISSKGEENPVAINRTADNYDAPKGRALNRRVHFKASVPSGILIERASVEVPDHLKIK